MHWSDVRELAFLALPDHAVVVRREAAGCEQLVVARRLVVSAFFCVHYLDGLLVVVVTDTGVAGHHEGKQRRPREEGDYVARSHLGGVDQLRDPGEQQHDAH